MEYISKSSQSIQSRDMPWHSRASRDGSSIESLFFLSIKIVAKANKQSSHSHHRTGRRIPVTFYFTMVSELTSGADYIFTPASSVLGKLYPSRSRYLATGTLHPITRLWGSYHLLTLRMYSDLGPWNHCLERPRCRRLSVEGCGCALISLWQRKHTTRWGTMKTVLFEGYLRRQMLPLEVVGCSFKDFLLS